MAHQVPWNVIILNEFLRLTAGTMTEEEEHILRTRLAGWSITKQAMEMGMSESTVSRKIAKLKRMYDSVQPYSTILPKRRTSAEEKWMDEN